MTICATIRNCHISTFHDDDGVIISVGVYFRGDIRFVTICAQDPIFGCQHIMTRSSGGRLLIEKIARALRLAADE